ncbi:hypothetical protein [Alicycliphilus denitrificans]|uniref:hypothetical protein n=1 Tax=Alicycliphilus denitrificans TaxID=179636 RepID=UPI00384AF87B
MRLSLDRFFFGPLAALCLAALLPMQASAQAAAPDAVPPEVQEAQLQRQARRAQIQVERQALQAQRSKEEADCYQQFAVHDCLRGVRTQARAADNRLRRQEVQLNDEERREKAAERLRSIEERQQEQRQGVQPGERPPAMRATERGSAQMREQQARQRAEQQQRRSAEHAADQQQHRQAERQRAAESRARYEAKQQKARERREQHQRDQAQAAGSGRKASAPLPDPSP